MVLYLCVLIVFSLRRESLKLILATDSLPRWFCHNDGVAVELSPHFNALGDQSGV
jgi:hypothetical protein